MTITESSPYDSITFGNPLSLRVDGGVGSVSINPSGRDVVLAGRRGLYVVDLDDPFSPPRWLHHLTSWEVADVQWSPHPSRPSWVISTSNQKALLWNLARPGDDAIEHVLHGHSRAITDINFHPRNPDLLATCSIDTFVNAWDVRTPRRPIYAVEDWRAGAAQVKWNYQNDNILASAHNNYFYVWDLRNNSKPMHKIYAHDAKINGVDFSKTSESQIISCSNDQTVKFWDLSKDVEKPISTIHTDFPVWKARNLPFGEGCAIIPLRGGNNSTYLARKPQDGEDITLQPEAVFKGHTDRVTDFLWRCRHTDSGFDDREFQLVTWSKDCDLKLWTVEDELYPKLNHVKGKPISIPKLSYQTYREEPEQATGRTIPNKHANQISLKLTNEMFVSGRTDQKNTTDHLNWISGVRIGRSAFSSNIESNNNNNYGMPFEHGLDNLGEEVSVIGHKFPKVKFEKISVSTGVLVLSLAGSWDVKNIDDLVYLRVEMRFPKDYPSAPPLFKIEENRDLSTETRAEILSTLAEITKIYAKHSKFSLEICLRYLMGDKIDINTLESELTNHEDHVTDIYDIPIMQDMSDLESLPSSSEDEALINDEDNDTSGDELGDDELIPGMLMSQSSTGLLNQDDQHNFDSTPLPKGCGAVWSRQGKLVCFFMPKHAQSFDSKPSKSVIKFDQSKQVLFDEGEVSDDSLSDDFNDILMKDMGRSRGRIPGVFRIQNFGTGFNSERHSSAGFGGGGNPTETLKSGNSIESEATKNVVAVFDFSELIPTKYHLADEYRVIGDSASSLALYNSEICAKFGYAELADTWRVLSTVLSPEFDWGVHPLGEAWLIRELMSYYEKMADVQMLAMMSCIIETSRIQKYQHLNSEPDIFKPLSKANPTFQRDYRLASMSSNESNYGLPFSRSSSVVTKENEKSIHVKIEMQNEATMGFIEDAFIKDDLFPGWDSKFQKYRNEYANILYIWGFISRRAEILKFDYSATSSSAVVSNIKDEEYQTRVKIGRNDKSCTYCGLRVKRQTFVCFKCDHVAHTSCAEEWWLESDVCASGCGCHCLEE